MSIDLNLRWPSHTVVAVFTEVACSTEDSSYRACRASLKVPLLHMCVYHGTRWKRSSGVFEDSATSSANACTRSIRNLH